MWLLAVLLAAAIFFGQQMFKPKPGLWRNAQVTQEHYNVANKANALDPGETINCIYKSDKKDMDEWFCLVTDKRVVVFNADNTGSPVTAMELAKIDDWSKLSITVSDITLTDEDGNTLIITVSRDKHYDDKLMNAIHKGMRSVGNDPYQMDMEDVKDILEFFIKKE